MERLTHEQESNILKSLIGEKPLDNGASRVVFNCTQLAADTLNISIDEYVIKLAIGVGGLRQTMNEVDCFLEHQTAPLAKIIAAGRYIEVMEKVSPEDYRDLAGDFSNVSDYMEEYDFDNTNGEYDFLYEINDVIQMLEDVFGSTSDNGQIGKTKDGRWVAYDYGFSTEYGCDSQTSDLTDYLDLDTLEDYLYGLVELLDAEEEQLYAFEKRIIKRVSTPSEDYMVEGVYIYQEQPYKMLDNHFSNEDAILEYAEDNLRSYNIYHIEYDEDGEEINRELLHRNFTEEDQQFFDKEEN